MDIALAWVLTSALSATPGQDRPRWILNAWTGVSIDRAARAVGDEPTDRGLPAVGLDLLLLGEMWSVGFVGDFAGQRLHLGGAAGFHLAQRAVNVHILAEVGGNRIDASPLFELWGATTVRAATAWLPYAGGRLGVNGAFGDGQVRFVIGVWLLGGSDIGSEKVTQRSRSCGSGWFGAEPGPCQTLKTEYVLGGFRIALALRMGVAF